MCDHRGANIKSLIWEIILTVADYGRKESFYTAYSLI